MRPQKVPWRCWKGISGFCENGKCLFHALSGLFEACRDCVQALWVSESLLDITRTSFQLRPGCPQWVICHGFGTHSGSNPWVLNLCIKRTHCYCRLTKLVFVNSDSDDDDHSVFIITLGPVCATEVNRFYWHVSSVISWDLCGIPFTLIKLSFHSGVTNPCFVCYSLNLFPLTNHSFWEASEPHFEAVLHTKFAQAAICFCIWHHKLWPFISRMIPISIHYMGTFPLKLWSWAPLFPLLGRSLQMKPWEHCAFATRTLATRSSKHGMKNSWLLVSLQVTVKKLWIRCMKKLKQI